MSNDVHRISLATLDAMLTAALRPHRKDIPSDLRWRLKQIQRQDWPSTLIEDPSLKRGYTVRQALRVVAAMALVDASQGPTLAVQICRDNENAILAIMHTRTQMRVAGTTAAEPLYGVLSPAILEVLDGDLNPDGAVRITPVSAHTLAKELAADETGRARLVLDFGGLAHRALKTWAAAHPGQSRDPIDAMLASAARATLQGRGYQPQDVPSGDRYASPRRSKAVTT